MSQADHIRGGSNPHQATDRTIDHLAAEVGLPVSTIRMYQNDKLLEPPERRGRVGYYGPAHVSRLRHIIDLKERGFSLAAIAQALEAMRQGQTIGDLLSVDPSQTPSTARSMPVGELAGLFSGASLTQSEIRRAADMGLISPDGDQVTVHQPAFLEIGTNLSKMGVPISVLLDEYEELSSMVGIIADRFSDVFRQHVWLPFEKRGFPDADVVGLVDTVDQLRALARAVVLVELERQFAVLADEFLSNAEDDRD